MLRISEILVLLLCVLRLVEPSTVIAGERERGPQRLGSESGWPPVVEEVATGCMPVGRSQSVAELGRWSPLLVVTTHAPEWSWPGRAAPEEESEEVMELPELTLPLAVRNREGFLSLRSVSGRALVYTLDGGEPGADSPRYEGPVYLPGRAELRVREVSADGRLGPELRRRFEVAPLLWTVATRPTRPATVEGDADAMIDTDPDTAFVAMITAIELDFGEELASTGLSYRPPPGDHRGTLRALRVFGRVNEEWVEFGEFELAGAEEAESSLLLSWPEQAVDALRLEALQPVEAGAPVAVAELELRTTD